MASSDNRYRNAIMSKMGDLKFTTAESFIESQKEQTMTPQEVFEIKTQWMLESFDVKVKPNDAVKAVRWCEENCEPWQWDFERWDHPASHLMSFENEVDAKDFQEYMEY